MADPEDPSLEFTALREAREEVGLKQKVEILGRLDDLPTLKGDAAVTPIVAFSPKVPQLRANPREVARIFDIPLGALGEAVRWETRYSLWEGHEVPIYSFSWDGELLWGLSAYITLQLLSLGNAGCPLSLPDWLRL